MQTKGKKPVLANLYVEKARIVIRNFSGEERQYNAKGMRNFCLLLDQEQAENLKAQGWNVKAFKQRDPDEPVQAFVKIKVMFGDYPPKIFLISNKNKKTELNEDSVMVLDHAELANIDLVISPSYWEMNGRNGITGYLKTMYATLAQTDFNGKYENVPEENPLEEDREF